MKITILTIALAVATTAFAGQKSPAAATSAHKKTHASLMKKHKKHVKKAASTVVSAPVIG